ncbi:MAG: glycosyltransferase, partial [Clostridia bacterium]
MNILFFSVSAGGGHMKAAEAVSNEITRKHPDYRILVVDTLRYANPVVDKFIINGLYLNAVKNTPQIWGKLYDMAETGDNVNDLSKAVNRLLSRKIKSLINDFNPSVIVCTHPFPLQMLSNMKKKGKVTAPIIAILTDHVVHPFWLYENIDAYVVSNSTMKYEMIKKGFSPNIVFDYGIPVKREFIERKTRSNILRVNELEDKTTILIMGGSLGYGSLKSVFMSIIKSDNDVQIIVITGHNKKLKKQLEKYSLEKTKSVKIISYTDSVADFMQISDLIITKPGGVTVSEALAESLPIIIMSPIPGQEERNAQFLLNCGVAARITETDDVDTIL